MGNCCCPESDENQALTTSSGGRRPPAFQGEGHRLGTANETSNDYQNYSASAPMQRDDNIPEPMHDKSLSEEERAKIRADRAAAAEARLKKQGGGAPKKKKVSSDAPLRGPNSKPTMTWTAG